MKLFIIVMAATLLGANFYVFLRLWQMIPTGNIGRVLLVAGGVVAVSSFFLYFFIGGSAPVWLTSAIYRIGTSWPLILLYLLIIFLLLDLLRAVHLLPQEVMRGNWTTLALLGAFIVVVFTTGYLVYLRKDRVGVDIALDKETAPLRIVAVSDLHLGYGTGGRELAGWVELINAEHPDAVVIAGDLIDTDTRPLVQRDMAEILDRIEAKYGVYMALGNHEYISGAAKSADFIDGTKITLLRDSAVLVGGRFYIAGRDDLSNRRRKEAAELTAGLDRSKPIVMLDHQPHDLGEAVKAGVDLQISGHTHRGQIWPISWITDGIFEKSHGYLRKGNTHIFVSSGLGIWGGKFRIGTRSEYVVIDITGKR